MPTKLVSANIKRSLSWVKVKAALDKIIAGKADVIGLQEIMKGTRMKQVRKYLAQNGYALAVANDVPIAFDVKKYKLSASNAKRLPGRNTPGSNPQRYANWVALTERKTGRKTVVTNTHLHHHRPKAQRKQVAALADLQRTLRQQFGDDAAFYLMGDLNIKNAKKLAPLTQNTGLRKSVQSSPIDYIFSESKAVRTRSFETPSDHDALVGVYKNERPSKNNGGGGGSGGGGGGGPKPKPPKNPGPGGGGDVPLSAYDIFSDLLESWGIPIGTDIEAIIRNAVVEGLTPDNIGLIIPDIQNTQSWKTRFPGWHARTANGYNQLTVDEYLSLEDTYHRILEEAGLPSGFYDDYSDFGKFISENTSPDEVQERVQMATAKAQEVDPTARNLMARFYGLTTGDVASYFLDPKRALPVIERQFNAAGVASWASRAGFDVNSMSRYESLVDAGISPEAASQQYGTVKTLADTVGGIAGIYGENYSQTDAEDDVFFGKSDKRNRIVSQERATFGGSSRGATGTAQRQSY